MKQFLCDGGYSGSDFASKIKEITGADVTIAKRNELHKFAVIAKRWFVERSFTWLEKCCRLWKNCERYLSSFRTMILLAFTRPLLCKKILNGFLHFLHLKYWILLDFLFFIISEELESLQNIKYLFYCKFQFLDVESEK